MSPKQQRGEVTAGRLLAAALKVHAANGRQGFTVNAVTTESGVSLGSLYHHFGSFDGLAATLYNRCIGQLFDELIAALRRTRTCRTGIRAVVVTYLRFTQQHPDAALFIHASAYAGYLDAHAEKVDAVKADKLAAVADWLRPFMAAGEIATVPAPLIEALLIGPVSETSRRWLAGKSCFDLDEAARVLPDRIWRSLRPD